MRCICCLSEKIITNSFNLPGYHSCLCCGLVFKERGKELYDQKTVAHHYERVDPRKAVADSKQHFFNLAVSYLSSQCKQRKRSILDVGCGCGYFLELGARNGWETFGVEIVDDAAREAGKRIGGKNIFHGTVKEANYPENSFDVITLWDVLFVIQDPFKELKECYRIIKEGGIVGIRVRNVFFQKMAYRFYCPLRRLASRWGVKKPSVFHQYCFSRKSLYQLLRRVGFTQVEVSNSPLTEGDPYGHTNIKFIAKAAKVMITLISGFILWISSGNKVVGPSLLVWAKKPHSCMKSQ